MKQKEGQISAKPADPFQILPQAEWTESRRRLVESVNRAANILLNRLDIKRTSRELVSTGIQAHNNYTAALILLNQEITKRYSKPRKEWSAEEFKTAMSEIDNIVNKLTRTYKKKFHDE